MSINNWGWKHYHGKERSMAYYLAHPSARDEDETPPPLECPECDGQGDVYDEDAEVVVVCPFCDGRGRV